MTIDKSKIFHPFNSDMAKKYIGCKGWFSDNFHDLDKSVPPTVLTDVCNNTDFPFAYSKTGYNESLFRYLPGIIRRTI